MRWNEPEQNVLYGMDYFKSLRIELSQEKENELILSLQQLLTNGKYKNLVNHIENFIAN